MENLAQKKCQPCEGVGEALSKDQAQKHLASVKGWELSSDGKSISRGYVMKNFMAAVKFINEIAAVAQAEDHHPDLHLTGYRKFKVELSTHAVGGLSENDFILASKINTLPAEVKI